MTTRAKFEELLREYARLVSKWDEARGRDDAPACWAIHDEKFKVYLLMLDLLKA